jgi:hypothetical protein
LPKAEANREEEENDNRGKEEEEEERDIGSDPQVRHWDHLAFAPTEPAASPPPSPLGQVPPLDVLYYRIEEFTHPPDFLQEGDVVIFDDVQTLTPIVLETINFYTHHLNLCATFVICQALLGTKLYPLISLVHNFLLLCGSNTVTRLAKYVITTFYYDVELKSYLQSILSYAQKHNHTVWLEINSLGNVPSPHLAISAVEKIFPDDVDNPTPYCLVYPRPGKAHLYASRFADNFASVDMPGSNDFPAESFVLVPAKHVTQAKRAEAADNEGGEGTATATPKCARRDQWDTMNREIEKMIQNTFEPKKWKKARNLASEILKNPELCISDDGRLLMLKKDKSHKMAAVSLMDFLIQCLRQQGPAERPGAHFQIYAHLVQLMIDHATPASYFNNRALLNPRAAAAAAAAAQRRRLNRPSPFGSPVRFPRSGGGRGGRGAGWLQPVTPYY